MKTPNSSIYINKMNRDVSINNCQLEITYSSNMAINKTIYQLLSNSTFISTAAKKQFKPKTFERPPSGSKPPGGSLNSICSTTAK